MSNKHLLLSLIAVLTLLLLSGCATTPRPIHDNTPQGDSHYGLKTIYISNHGSHTGVVVRGADLPRTIAGLNKKFKNPQYLEFGWGDKDFYQASDKTMRMALRAVFWPTATVMHVVGFQEEPLLYFHGSKVTELAIPESYYDNLLSFIESSFARDEDGQIIPLGKGQYERSQFYEAQGTYFIFNTCNTWVAKALASAGFDISVNRTLTADGVAEYLEQLR